MGLFGAIGKAIKAPAKPLNKMMGALPGGNSANKMMGKALPGLGIGPSPKATPPQASNPWAAAAQGAGQIGGQLGGGNMERPPQPIPEMQPMQAPAGPPPQGFQSSPMPQPMQGGDIGQAQPGPMSASPMGPRIDGGMDGQLRPLNGRMNGGGGMLGRAMMGRGARRPQQMM
jgi:hypothetical protein